MLAHSELAKRLLYEKALEVGNAISLSWAQKIAVSVVQVQWETDKAPNASVTLGGECWMTMKTSILSDKMLNTPLSQMASLLVTALTGQ